jgi:hypothetical protein
MTVVPWIEVVNVGCEPTVGRTAELNRGWTQEAINRCT